MSDFSILPGVETIKNILPTTSSLSGNVSSVINNIITVAPSTSTVTTKPIKLTGEKRWEIVTQEKKVAVDSLIDKYKCQGDSKEVEKLWSENKRKLQNMGITHQLLWYRNGLDESAEKASRYLKGYKKKTKKSTITNKLLTILEKIAPQKGELYTTSGAACLWLSHSKILTDNGMDRNGFSNYCKINPTRLRITVRRMKISEIKQKIFTDADRCVNRLIVSNRCKRHAQNAASVWLDNKEKMISLGVNKEDFSNKCQLKPEAIADVISQRIKNQSMVTKQQSLFINGKIEDNTCRGDAGKASAVWIEHGEEFINSGITLKIFAGFCRLTYQNLTKRIDIAIKMQTRLSSENEEWLKQFIDVEGCSDDVIAVVTTWRKHRELFNERNINLQCLGLHSKVNLLTLNKTLYEKRNEYMEVSEESKALIEYVIRAADAETDPQKAMMAFFDNEEKLLEKNITSNIFSYYSKLPPKQINSLIFNKRKENEKVARSLQDSLSQDTSSAGGELSKLEQEWMRLTHVNKKLINEAIINGGCEHDMNKSVEVWLKNREIFQRQHIKQRVFAFKCGFSGKEIKTAVGVSILKASRNRKLTTKQKLLFDNIDLNYQCKGNCTVAAQAWLEHSEELKTLNIKRSFFASYYHVSSNYLSSKVKHNDIKNVLNEEVEGYLNDLIFNFHCSDNLKLAAKIWCANQQQLIDKGVTQIAFAKKCRVNFASFRNICIYTNQEGIELSEPQLAVLSEFTKNTGLVKGHRTGNFAGVIALWLAHQPELINVNIKLGTLAKYFGVNSSALIRRSHTEQKKLLLFNAKQQALFDKLTSKDECAGNFKKTIDIWLDNEKELKAENIYFHTFTAKCSIKSTALLTKMMLVQQQGNTKLLPQQKKLLSNIIDCHQCFGDLPKSITAWFKEISAIEDLNINNAQFSKHCGVDVDKFIHAVDFKSSLVNDFSPGEDLNPKDIKIEPHSTQNGIAEIILNEEGETVDVGISKSRRLVDSYVIDNSLPIIHTADKAKNSITLPTLGFDKAYDFEKIKITHWGAMHSIFSTMSNPAAINLKNKLLVEIHNQIANETGQSTRMATQMVSRGSHRQARDSDEIINLGEGVINPGKESVPAFTVLGLYSGILQDSDSMQQTVRKRGAASTLSHVWSTRKQQYSVDAYSSGNILRNVNTGCLPGQAELAVNNVAAVQVKSRLIAYITLADIPPGDEYFVDYGSIYNPAENVELAKKRERMLKLYHDNQSKMEQLNITLSQFSAQYNIILEQEILATQETANGVSLAKKISPTAKLWFEQHPLQDVLIKQEPQEFSEALTPKMLFIVPANKNLQLQDGREIHRPTPIREMHPDPEYIDDIFGEKSVSPGLRSATPGQIVSHYQTLRQACELATHSFERAADHMLRHTNLGSQLASICGYGRSVDRALCIYFELLKSLLDAHTLTAQDIYSQTLSDKGGGISAATRALTRVNCEMHPITRSMVRLLIAAGEQAGTHHKFRTFLESFNTDPAHPQVMMQCARDGINRLKHAALEDWLRKPKSLSPSAMEISAMLETANLLPINSHLAQLVKTQRNDVAQKTGNDEAVANGYMRSITELHEQLVNALPDVSHELVEDYANWEQLDKAATDVHILSTQAAKTPISSHPDRDIFAQIAELRSHLAQANFTSHAAALQKDMLFEQQQVERRRAMNSPHAQHQAINLFPALLTEPFINNGARAINIKSPVNKDSTSQNNAHLPHQAQWNALDKKLARLNESDKKTAVIEERLARLRGQSQRISTTPLIHQTQKTINATRQKMTSNHR